MSRSKGGEARPQSPVRPYERTPLPPEGFLSASPFCFVPFSPGKRESRRHPLTFFISRTTRGTMRRSLPSTWTGELTHLRLHRGQVAGSEG